VKGCSVSGGMSLLGYDGHDSDESLDGDNLLYGIDDLETDYSVESDDSEDSPWHVTDEA